MKFKLFASFVVASFLAFGGEEVKPLDPVPLKPLDAQRMTDIAKEEAILQAQYKAIQEEKEAIRLRTCMSGKLDLEHCGTFTVDGKMVQVATPPPAPPAVPPAKP